ncbi:MAG: pimeloyl-ACP methyl ester esterase BioH [Acidiferrobacterales bacterium]
MTTVYFEQTGAGPDVMLIHGWGLHGGIFDGLVDQLANNYRVTTVDLPGHGRSATPDHQFDLDKTADVLANTIGKPAVWLGWSLGGLVAMAVASRHAEAVKALVLVSATPRFVKGEDWPHAMAPETLDAFAAGLAEDYQATLDRFLSLQIGKEENSRALIRQLREQLLVHGKPDPIALAAGLDILRDTDLRPRLATLEQPALVINGGRDRLTPPAAGEYLASTLAHGQYSLFEDAGHAAFLSHPREFAARLREFLDEQQ